MRAFHKAEIGRLLRKLWGAGFADWDQLHPAYQPVSDLAEEYTDLFVGTGCDFEPCMGACGPELTERITVQTEDPLWRRHTTIFHTPKGDLQQVEMLSNIGEPGYTIEHFIKEPEDIDKMLSLPYTPYPVDARGFENTKRRLGDRGAVMVGCDHAGYAMQRMIGSENMAIFSFDCRDKLVELCSVFAGRIYDHAKSMLEAGKDSGRFILCPSAGYMEYARPSQQYIENLKFYIQYGYEAVEWCRK